MKPNVIASVIGIENAINSAERHSQKPINAMITTSPPRARTPITAITLILVNIFPARRTRDILRDIAQAMWQPAA